MTHRRSNNPQARCRAFPILVALLFLSSSLLVAGEREIPFERTEERADCRSYDARRQPFFGATHLHTGLSFDASLRFVKPRPLDAYRFAQGKAPIQLVGPAGNVRWEVKLDRPLDWGAVTDHSEFFGEMGICKAEGDKKPKGYDSLECQLLRGFYWQPGVGQPPVLQRQNASAAFGILVLPNLGPWSLNTRLPLCHSGEADCQNSELKIWDEMQWAAEQAYDRSEDCSFTSFVGYEVASTPSGTNWHRNVIFRNDRVVERPITAIDMAAERNLEPNKEAPRWLNNPDVNKLWDGLKRQCLDLDNGCDVLTIPHNSNLGGGLPASSGAVVAPMFFDPTSAEQALKRQRFEPLVEIYQDKGSSECRWDPRFREGVDTTDEHCAFELLESPSILAATGVDSEGGMIPPSAFDERAYVRNVLKDGLSFVQGNEQSAGESWPNPFKLGIVAASDSHDGTMGWHPEDATFRGHLGIEDAIPVNSAGNIQNSSGGNTVVWAEENSRDAIFSALKRKETYGTSGPRLRVRFFGGWGFAEDLCEGDLVAAGYGEGVPMGGDMPPVADAAAAPRFVTAAWMDDYLGTPLERIQIIKGWVEKKPDGTTETFEKVYDVAGGPNGASVDSETCRPQGKGHKFLCAVFEDPDFDPAVPAFYYTRVLENPVCRYSSHYCRENFQVNPLATDCPNQLLRLKDERPLDYQNAQFCCSNETTSPIVQPTIQERAWTSPIWYTPEGLR